MAGIVMGALVIGAAVAGIAGMLHDLVDSQRRQPED